jgi:hypothetical protein
MKKIYQFMGIVAGLVGINNSLQAQVTTQTFSYTGGTQSLTIPGCVGQVTITCFGASGASGLTGSAGSPGGTGGLGSIVRGVYSVTAANTVLNLFVGGTATANVGGFNGGASNSAGNGGGGGGATDVRVSGTLTTNRVLVAGGGGGAGNGGCLTATVNGGNGGNGAGNGVNGVSASTSGGLAGGGFGGIGITGGLKGVGCAGFSGLDATNGTAAGLGGPGGNGQVCCCVAVVGGGAGGGGFIGGGGGGGGSAGTTGCQGNDKGGGGGGAGGSDFFSPAFTNTAVLTPTNSGNGLITISYIVTTPTITVNSGAICAGQSFTISPSGATIYTLQSGSPVVTPTATSTYSIVGGNGIIGCVSNVVTSTVTVNALPVVTVANGTICAGNSLTLTPSGANTYTYQGGSAVVSPSATTSYTVIGSNSVTGCVSNPVSANVTVNALPNVTVNSSTICNGQSALLTAAGATTYTWSNAATTTTVSVNPTTNTSYTVTGVNANGCSKSATTSVVVNPTPTVSVVSSASLICVGQSATLTPSGASTYTINSGSFVISPTVTTSYTVTGVASNSCSSTSVFTQNVSPCTGIDNVSLNGKGLNVFPSPTNGLVTVQLTLTAGQENTIKVVNMLGQVMLTKTLVANETTLDMSNFKNGVYFVKVKQGETEQTIKIIKE